MLVLCPKCQCKARIQASKQMADSVRYLYCQCQNLNCAVTFKGELTFIEYIQDSKKSSPPDPELQPELLKTPSQSELSLDTPCETAL